ncbi:glycoside hydrolase family 3 C-terminal domain-containing protein [Thalassotalea sp. PLHSN55]|uniref:glycoside hydrolase family 3 C-terminal domain-containing protein n=1 Tax=Thalassotalea sp. PLHSN55 TaxID=3435888 RepID=UPI003F847A2D
MKISAINIKNKRSLLSLTVATALLSSGCSVDVEEQGSTIQSSTKQVSTKQAAHSAKLPAFKDESLPIEQRVAHLIKQMTLEEKVSQLFDKAPEIKRLGVDKYYWWNEALHGVARAGSATVFPQAIGLAATFDEALILKVGTAISDEGRAKHHAFLTEGNRSMYTGLTYWSPNINIFRDPRWGRGQETYGEDPLLTTRIATNFIHGLQGDDDKYLKSVATLKHYAVHSGPEVSRHSDDYTASAKDLAETYLPAFKDTIAATNVASIMCAYNSVNGEPACGNSELMDTKLRGEFNFNGYIVSDCGAIADFYDKNSHHIVKNEVEAAAKALKTGTDLNCGDHHGNTFSYLVQAVEQGLVSENDVDLALTRLLSARFKLGMFDSPENVPFAHLGLDTVGTKAHLALTQEAAEKSLVLLKNDNLLPLSGKEKVALIGPNADNLAVLVGNYHGTPVNPITVKQALAEKLGDKLVGYQVGSSLTGDVYSHYQSISADNFFHTDHQGNIQPGLITEYFADAHFGNQPSFRQIEKNIDKHWLRSPIDGSVEQEFAIKWRGILTPEHSGSYRFNSKNVEFTLDGKSVHGAITLEEGRQYQFSAEAKLHHYWHSNVIEPQVQLAWLNEAQDINGQALAASKDADVIIFVGGITANLEGEEMPLELDGFSHGDRTHIQLPKSQERLLKQLAATGKPIVFVNMSGSAMALNWQEQNVEAIIQGFYPGEATGSALARLLYGEANPSGKLPITFYQSVADLPDFKDYSMNNRTYKYYQGDVLYPFGYGLSYADVNYSQGEHSFNKTNNNLTLAATLTNHSKFASEEVVQVYLTLVDTPITTPQKQLIDFKRVQVAANGSAQVSFTIDRELLSYIDEQGQRQQHQGKAILTLGAGQGIKIPQHQVVTFDVNVP